MSSRLEDMVKLVDECGCDHEFCGNREAVKNLKEILEDLKPSESQILSPEDFKKLDNEITERIVKEVQNLSKEPIDKEAIKDSYHLKSGMIKNHINVTKIEREKRLDEYQKSCEDFQKTLLKNQKLLNHQKTQGLFYMKPGIPAIIRIQNSLEYEKNNQELVNSVLKEEKAMIDSLNSDFESLLTSMLILKCFPLIMDDDKVFEYLEDIDKDF